MEFNIYINNIPTRVKEGELLLPVLKRFGIHIPTLCNMEDFSPTGACRMCVVEVEGRKELVTSCTFPVEENLRIKTNSQRVMRARKSIVEMLLSNHPDDCLYCVRNYNCELQKLASEMHVVERRFHTEKRPFFPDHSSPSVMRDAAKCVLCSRCVRVCDEMQEVTAIDFVERSNQTVVNSAFKRGLNISNCIHCGQCITVCPTGALSDISAIDTVQAALGDARKKVYFLISPSVAVSFAEHFGLKPQKEVMGVLTTVLKKLGGTKVFDLGMAIDLNIMLEAEILAQRLREGIKEPLISSCCPSWVRYAETFMPETTALLSPIRSPQQMLGKMLKEHYANENQLSADDMFVVSLTPCVGARFEITRPEMAQKGVAEVDAVITIRELMHLIHMHRINILNMPASEPDKPFAIGSALGIKAGYSGGKSEAIALELYHLLKTKPTESFRYIPGRSPTGIKEAKVQIGHRSYVFAWAASHKRANKLLNHLRTNKKNEVCYIEIMSCPDGCLAGGGQPIEVGKEKWRNRKKICQEMEKDCEFSVAFTNTQLQTFLNTLNKKLGNQSLKTLFKTGFEFSG